MTRYVHHRVRRDELEVACRRCFEPFTRTPEQRERSHYTCQPCKTVLKATYNAIAAGRASAWPRPGDEVPDAVSAVRRIAPRAVWPTPPNSVWQWRGIEDLKPPKDPRGGDRSTRPKVE